MDEGRFSISADVLYQRIGAAAPIVIDSRRAPAFDTDGWIIVGGICCPRMKWPRGSVTGRITCRSSSHLDYGTNVGDYVDAFMQAPR
jgi:hypothetical protein